MQHTTFNNALLILLIYYINLNLSIVFLSFLKNSSDCFIELLSPVLTLYTMLLMRLTACWQVVTEMTT